MLHWRSKLPKQMLRLFGKGIKYMVAMFQISLYMTSLKSLECCIQFGEPVTEINTGKWGPNQGLLCSQCTFVGKQKEAELYRYHAWTFISILVFKAAWVSYQFLPPHSQCHPPTLILEHWDCLGKRDVVGWRTAVLATGCLVCFMLTKPWHCPSTPKIPKPSLPSPSDVGLRRCDRA